MIIEPQWPRIKVLREDDVKGFRSRVLCALCVLYKVFPRLPRY